MANSRSQADILALLRMTDRFSDERELCKYLSTLEISHAASVVVPHYCHHVNRYLTCSCSSGIGGFHGPISQLGFQKSVVNGSEQLICNDNTKQPERISTI